MPLHWQPTLRKSAVLTALNVFARARRLTHRAVTAPPNDVRSILVIELWNIGDVLLALPFLARLRSTFPAARISLLAGEHALDLLAGTSLVDEIIVTTLGRAKGGMGIRTFVRGLREQIRVGLLLRKRKFHRAYHARLHVREHVLLAMASAQWSEGYSFRPGDTFLDRSVTPSGRDRHKAADWMALLGTDEVAQPVRLPITDSERKWAIAFLESQGFLGGNALIGIHPGASRAEKRWPLANFREVAEHFARRQGVQVIAFADPQGYGSKLWSVPGVMNASVSLRQLMAILDRCSLLLCNDSGPMHLAAALGVPTVAVFEPGIADWFSPLGNSHRTVSPVAGAGAEGPGLRSGSPISTIRVGQVVNAAEDALRDLNLNKTTELGRDIAIGTEQNTTTDSE